jgi:hypothetical protein
MVSSIRFGFLFFTFLFAVIGVSINSAQAETKLNVAFADGAWDGKKIPKGQHCKKFGGKGSTPALKVSNIPQGANAIIVEFNDASYSNLSRNGGHGKVGWKISAGAEATLKAVPGGTKNLPDGTWLVKKNRATGAWNSPGYLPPCSGGKGNKYVATVKAVRFANGKVEEELAKGKITLGRY